MNQVSLIGRAGGDPERAEKADVVKVSIAVSEKIKNKEYTSWIKLEAWGKVGEILEKYVKKGHLVAVQGKIKTNVV